MNVSVVPEDTTQEAGWVHLAILRRMPAEKRLERVFQMNASARGFAAAGVRSRHPDYTDDQVRLAVIRLTLGDELFREVYPEIWVVP